jgi:hypothetical protein
LNEASNAEFDLTLTSYGNSVRLFIDEAAPNNRYQVRHIPPPQAMCGGAFHQIIRNESVCLHTNETGI